MIALAACLILCFALLTALALSGATSGVDQAALALLRDQSAPRGPLWLAESARDVTALGSYSVLSLLALSAALLLAAAGRLRTALFAVLVPLGGLALNTGLKALFERPRPALDGAVTVFTSSFPSAHAQMSLTVMLALAMAAAPGPQRRLAIGLALLVSMLAGLSRVYLGAHFPSDVLAGWCVGGGWVALCLAAARRLSASASDRR